MPYVDAAMRRCFMISSDEYAGSSIWKKQVWASGRMSSPPFLDVSLNGRSQLSALGNRELRGRAWRVHVATLA